MFGLFHTLFFWVDIYVKTNSTKNSFAFTALYDIVNVYTDSTYQYLPCGLWSGSHFTLDMLSVIMHLGKVNDEL